jgi:hypothetical protein
MSNIYTWVVASLDCYPSYEAQTNVVHKVEWVCTGQTSTEPTVSSSITNSINLFYVEGQSFTPFNELTQETILNWIWNSGVDKNAVQQDVDRQIENIITKISNKQKLPWA